MFHLDISDDDMSSSQPPVKKSKFNIPCSSEIVHSSLGYSSFKAPPLVEYSSIDSYCERKLGKSLLPSCSSDLQSVSDLNKVKSISSPVVLNSPHVPAGNKNLANSNFVPPYYFFSIEELSMVKCLNHWSNTKVCPVGRIEFDVSSQQCSIHSILESGSWQVLLDTSLLKEIPKPKTLLQTFGCMEVVEEQPVLKIHFYRDLGSTDISLFVSSYRLMQKHVPNFLNLSQSISDDMRSPRNVDPVVGCELNDTLDDYNWSIIDKCVDNEEVNE